MSNIDQEVRESMINDTRALLLETKHLQQLLEQEASQKQIDDSLEQIDGSLETLNQSSYHYTDEFDGNF